MILDVVVLTVVIILTGISLYKFRSRALVFALSVFSLIWFGFVRKGCVCPVGSIENLTDYFFNGAAVVIPVVLLFAIPLIASLVAGRLFCGAACPLGAIQDLLSLDKLKLPKIVDQTLTLLPPAILWLVTVAVVRGDGYLLCRYDPFVSIFRFHAPLSLFIITAIAIVITLLISRPFCRFLCPYGVLLGLASVTARFKVQIEPKENCITCSLCPPACPSAVIRRGTGTLLSGKGKIGSALIFLILVPLGVVAGSHLAALPHWFFEPAEFVLDTSKMNQLILAGEIMGGIAALAWALEITKRIAPAKAGFNPNHHRCIDCGRCYIHCPGTIKQYKKGAVS